MGFFHNSVVLVFQDSKYISSESVASTSQRQKLMKIKLASVAANQEVMAKKQKEKDDRMKAMDVRQDVMGTNLKAILELLKQKPYALGFSHTLFILSELMLFS